MSDDEKTLSQAIENLAKKKHVISKEALEARKQLNNQTIDSSIKKRMHIIEEFNHSVSLLAGIFKASNFDDMAMFVSHPGRVLVLNFLIGILRGMGFVLGTMIMTGITIYLFQSSLPSSVTEPVLNIISMFKNA